MDFSIDDELDYEEDDLDSVKNDVANKNDIGDEVNENSNMSEGDNQYLELHCSEEEENFIEKAQIENINSKPEIVEKDEESKKPEPVKPPSPKTESLQTNNTNNSCKNLKTYKMTNKKFKKKERPFRHRAEVKNQVTNPFTFNQCFPNWDLPAAVNVVIPPNVSMYSHQTLNCNQDIFSNPSTPFPLLGFSAIQQNQNIPQLKPVDHRFLQSQPFSEVSSVGTGVLYNSVHQRNAPFANQRSGPSFNKNRLNFQPKNDKRIFSKRVVLKNVKPYLIKRQDNSKISTSGDKFSGRRGKGSDNFLTGEGKGNFRRRTFYNQNAKKIGSNIFSGCGIENSVGKREKNLGRLQCSLKNEEKELIKLKKEARLKRFMNDEIVKKEIKSDHSICEKETAGSLHLVEEQVKKNENLGGENLFSVKSQLLKAENSDGDTKPYVSRGKPDINKETLLNKRNPFDSGLMTSNCELPIKIKEEKEKCKEVKQEIFEDGLLAPISGHVMKKEKTTSESFGPIFGAVHNETDFPVKFVRTVSKRLDELGLRKPKVTNILDRKDGTLSSSYVNPLPFLAGKKMSFSTDDFSAQVESQLTGCIVKVFNIPPTITTNDILALCSPIGIVKEMKINLPKENSFVIRFAEPSCAENFFSAYHGQKMNNYFLNVIVV